MASGYAPNQGFVISLDKLRELFPDEMDDFSMAIDDSDYSLGEVFDEAIYCDEETGDEIYNTWSVLCDRFHRATGLALSDGFYYEPDNGSCYDTLKKGYYCFVEDVTTITSAGKSALEKGIISHEMWCVYG
jgi:hypothetical protein